MGKYDALIKMAGGSTAPSQGQDDQENAAPSGGKYASVTAMAPTDDGSSAGSSWGPKAGYGEDASNPIQESPLGIMQRAMLGWVRTPEQQHAYLQKNFDDVKPITTPSGGQSFAVKQKGKWFDVNPDMEWSGGIVTPHNIDAAIGKIAQDTGEYGVRGAAAAELGSAMATQGMAAGGTVAGPWGAAVGGLGGLVAGGAIGAMGAEGGDLASRQALMQDGAPGKTPYNADEVNKQLTATAMWGAQTALIGKSLELGSHAVADKFGQLVKYMTSSSPDGASAVKSFLKSLGVDDSIIESRLVNPQQNAAYDKIAAQDAKASFLQGTPKLDDLQESVTDDIHNQLKVAARKQGAQFDELQGIADKKNATFNLSKSYMDAKQKLVDAQLITPNGKPMPGRILSENDTKAINHILDSIPTSSGIDYAEARAKVSNDLGQNLIPESSGHMRAILTQLKDSVHNNITEGLDAVAEGVGQKYGDIVNKYSNSMMMKEALDSATSGNKRYSFVQKLLKENPNSTKAIVGEMLDNGVNTDNITKALQIEGSRQSTDWFSNKKILKYFPSPGPKLGAKMITAGSDVFQSARDTAASPAGQAVTPYLQHAVKWMKGLDQATRQAITTNPHAIQAIQGIIGGAAQGEPAATNSLLQNAGVTQQEDEQ